MVNYKRESSFECNHRAHNTKGPLINLKKSFLKSNFLFARRKLMKNNVLLEENNIIFCSSLFVWR